MSWVETDFIEYAVYVEFHRDFGHIMVSCYFCFSFFTRGLAKVALMMPLCFGQGLEFTLKKRCHLCIFSWVNYIRVLDICILLANITLCSLKKFQFCHLTCITPMIF